MSGNTNSDILIAGAIAAFTVDLLVYPLDTLKTRFQSPDYARLYTNSATGKPNPALFRGMYQGIGSVIIATLPSSGAFFTTYERTKSLFTDLNSTSSHPDGFLPTPVIHAGASSLAELVSCAILTPAEVIKQNAQMVSSDRSSTNATLQTLQKFRSNPLALWRGYASLAGRNLPFTAMQFPMFERLKQSIKQYRDARGLTTGSIVESGTITAVSAGTAGSIAAVITTPVDVLKTRIMLSAGEGEAASGAAQTSGKTGLVDALGKSVQKARGSQKGTWQIAQEILQEQGYKGLWRGGALRAVWTFVGAGLYLGAYESGRVYLAARRGEHVDEADLL
ncbi:mitochondrial carrier protein-like protein [Boeremia exigua]|uniref:mitochondrial carrier protein-like protein n=1 Tax=Boeremia exigua TaxID=749465 RepID=UPI001E8CA99D|nr:mitochondrial carrier protein-like protein [Boeremia exigua]KAH6614947.1 mitochondrial carrier protein-like protein [Boeremia exigua]